MARSSFYGRQAPSQESEEDLLRCWLIDEQYTRRPFYGNQRMVVYLADQRQHGPVVLRRLSGEALSLHGKPEIFNADRADAVFRVLPR